MCRRCVHVSDRMAAVKKLSQQPLVEIAPTLGVNFSRLVGTTVAAAFLRGK